MATTKVIIQELYPIVEKALTKNSAKLQNCIAKFINDRHEQLFDIAPYDRIYFNQSDLALFWSSIGLNETEVQSIIRKCYYYDIPENNGIRALRCAKEPYVMTIMMVIRYYLKKSQTRQAELTSVYLAFSG